MDIFSPTIIDNAIITGSNNASLLQVSSPSATSAFFISGSGRVGIGTTSPLSTLTVAGGDININSGYSIGGNFVGTYTSFITYHNDGLGFLQSASFGFRGSAYMDSISYPDAFGFGTNDLRFFTSTNGIAAPSEIMRMVGSTGFVGIGETSPSAKLEIRGSGATSATTALRVENSNTSASLVVTDNIRVGINKTTPNSELDVNGNTIITGSITSTSNITTLGSVATPSQTISGVNGWAPTSGTTNLLNIAGNLVPTATAIINSLAITSTVSQSVNPTTIIRGILVSPTFNTLGPQYRGFEWNNNQGFGLYGVGAAPNYLSGSLGIGTTSPSASLHISGASNSNLLRVGSPTNDNILFVSGSGNVGIGTTAPSVRLHLSQSSGTFQRVDINNANADGVNATTEYYTNTGATPDLFGATSFRLQGGTTDAFKQFQVYIANLTSPRFIINGSGNVGIGTTSPQRRLHVDASGSANTDIPLLLTSVDANNRVGIRVASSSVSAGRQHNLYHRNNSPLVEWILSSNLGESATWNFLPQDDTSTGLSFSVPRTTPGAIRIAAGINQSMLSLGASGSNQHLNISSSGNVGIGTTTPTQRLDVRGNTILAETAPINPIGGTLEVYNNGSNTQITIHEDSGSAEARLAFRTGGNDTIFRNTSNRFLIDAESKADAIVINSDGRVGIGVGNNAPSSVLQIRGEGATSATTALRVENSAAAARLTILDDGTSAFNTSHLYVSSSGNVGIGTATPVHNLVVDGNTGVSINAGGATFPNIHRDSADGGMLLRSWNGSTFTNNVKITPTTEVGIGTTNTSARLHVSGASNSNLLRVGSPAQANILFITGSGNIGVGTTTPGVTLDVVGQIRASTTMFNNTTQTNIIQLSSATNLQFLSASVETARYDNTGWGFFNTTPTARVHISGADSANLFRISSPSATNALFVTGSGNVGIGTNLPSADLHISGASADSLLRVGSPTDSNILFITGSGRVGIGTSTPDSKLHISSSGGYQLRVAASASFSSSLMVSGSFGFVGIGVESPQSILHVNDRPEFNNVTGNVPVAFFGNYQNITTFYNNNNQDNTVLGEPAAWMNIKCDGTEYLIPLYTS